MPNMSHYSFDDRAKALLVFFFLSTVHRTRLTDPSSIQDVCQISVWPSCMFVSLVIEQPIVTRKSGSKPIEESDYLVIALSYVCNNGIDNLVAVEKSGQLQSNIAKSSSS